MSVPGKLLNRDHREQRRILDEISKHPGQGRQDQPDRLWKYHVPISLDSSQADGSRGVELGNAHALNASPDDFADERPGKHRQSQQTNGKPILKMKCIRDHVKGKSDLH